MPFLELLGGPFLQFFADGLSSKAATNREAVQAGSAAMHRLAASLSEVVSDLEAGIHRMRKERNDPVRFSAELSALVDKERLQRSCHEAGVCADLRIAQDALGRAKGAFRGADADRVQEVIGQIDGYERVFVGHVHEFLQSARELDLKQAEGAQAPDAVLAALEDRVERLRALAGAVEKVSGQLRNSSGT